MKQRIFKILSLVLFIIGLFLIEPQVTGAVVGVSQSGIGILLVLISGVLFAVGEQRLEKKVKRNYAKELLKRGQIPEKSSELKNIAERMAFPVKAGGNHWKVLDKKSVREGEYVFETIPYGKLKRNTSRGILKKLDKQYAMHQA